MEKTYTLSKRFLKSVRENPQVGGDHASYIVSPYLLLEKGPVKDAFVNLAIALQDEFNENAAGGPASLDLQLKQTGTAQARQKLAVLLYANLQKDPSAYQGRNPFERSPSQQSKAREVEKLRGYDEPALKGLAENMARAAERRMIMWLGKNPWWSANKKLIEEQKFQPRIEIK